LLFLLFNSFESVVWYLKFRHQRLKAKSYLARKTWRSLASNLFAIPSSMVHFMFFYVPQLLRSWMQHA